MNLCINCKHCTEKFYCTAPQNIITDVVTGAKKPRLTNCESHRIGFGVGWLDARLYGYCGSAGRWFEPKEKEATV